MLFFPKSNRWKSGTPLASDDICSTDDAERAHWTTRVSNAKMCHELLNSLKGFTGVFLLQLQRDGYTLVVHLPVKCPSHGVSCLCLITEVVMVDHVDHRAHDGLPVLGDPV